MIQTMTNNQIQPPTQQEMNTFSEKKGFPLGPDDDVFGLSFTYGNQMMKEGQNKVARYFLSIAYDLTGDREIRELIDSL